MKKGKKEKKILVVEDKPVTIDILIRALSKDYEVFATKSGEKAIKIAEKIITVQAALTEHFLQNIPRKKTGPNTSPIDKNHLNINKKSRK